jgi:hypothetical protein
MAQKKKIPLVIRPHDYASTIRDEVTLSTDGIEGCVGLAFIAREGNILRRALSHLYCGSKDISNDLSEAMDLIGGSLSEFEDPSRVLVIGSYLPFHLGRNGNYSNPLWNELSPFLESKGIQIDSKLIDNSLVVKRPNDIRQGELDIKFKGLAVHHNKTYLMNYSSRDKIIYPIREIQHDPLLDKIDKR